MAMKPLSETVETLLRGQVDAQTLASGSSQSGIGRSLTAVLLLGGAFYGLCMGLYGALRAPDYGAAHVLGVMLKVPALFLLTLVVTAPSLYVFAALARSELSLRQTLRLMVAGSALSSVVLASFGPITAFFTYSTRSHPFMQVLNVALFAVAGLIGVIYLARNLGARDVEARPGSKRAAAAVLRLWFVIYAAVGLQMGWLLRPFIGSPSAPPAFLRETQGNVLEGLLEALRYL
jgi:hypothetical protein